MRVTRLTDESNEYRDAREELRLSEVALTAQREEVASQRRSLPPGPAVSDYEFLEGPLDLGSDTPVRTTRLSELFGAPERPLVVYHLMLGKGQTDPCPMCTMWLDGLNGVAGHVAERMDLVVVAAADPTPLRAYARERGWDHLRLLSCGDSTFKYDLGSEDAEGDQGSAISVFTREPNGDVRHRYTGMPQIDTDVHERGIDLLCAVWNLADLTPQGRESWYPSLSYA